ncbi:uncharacterized protein HD556DRAFT_392806 [Suillus plorans]|uniref:Uncharacterized protein n=1 Tax=Suillus plorans TaxID=116603 RepID=A0A9P7AS16_9AGAM|nr:uncharacterized protein HD556DRAFT_392806 [Suillus plorans]KAG1795106.1 hypothetical protein HD556DRAFT_392806 [Suillus plorans]
MDLASKLYEQLDNTSAARFASCRLHLPCMEFLVTDASPGYGPSQESRYEVKADGLHNLLITTKEPIVLADSAHSANLRACPSLGSISPRTTRLCRFARCWGRYGKRGELLDVTFFSFRRIT